MGRVVLECNNICKKFKNKVILDDVSFELCEGDIVGLIGKNGVGKTTLIKIILGLQKSSGSVIINGYDMNKDFVHAIEKVGATIENACFYNYLTGMENLKLKSRLYNVSDVLLNDVIKLVGLSDVINERVSKYSLGMKQRLAIAYAILGKPNVLILDEPTNGLDVEGMIDLRNIVLALSNLNMAILISSHLLSEIDVMCNKICMLKDGKIVLNKKIEEVKEKSYVLELDNARNLNLNYRNKLISNSCIEVWCNEKDIYSIIEGLIKQNRKLISFKEKNSKLEDIFLSEMGGSMSA